MVIVAHWQRTYIRSPEFDSWQLLAFFVSISERFAVKAAKCVLCPTVSGFMYNIKDFDPFCNRAVAIISCLWLMKGCFQSEDLIVLSRSQAMLVNTLSQFQYHDIHCTPCGCMTTAVVVESFVTCVDNCVKFSFKREMLEGFVW